MYSWMLQLILKPNVLVSDSIKDGIWDCRWKNILNYSVASNYTDLDEAPVEVLRMDLAWGHVSRLSGTYVGDSFRKWVLSQIKQMILSTLQYLHVYSH